MEPTPTPCATDASPDLERKIAKACDVPRAFLKAVANRNLPADVRARESGSDLVQKTMCEAVDALRAGKGPRLEADSGEWRAWLRGILINLIRTATRRHRFGKRDARREGPADSVAVEAIDSASSPSQIASRQEERERVRKALARLNDRDRQVLLWREEQGLTFEDIGTRLQISTNSARKTFLRASDRLKAVYLSESSQ